MKEIVGLLDKKFTGLILVVSITFLVYANTLGNGFVIEDEVFISNWPLTQNLSNIPKMIAGDTIPTGNWGAYRPVRAIVYAISYFSFGGNNPFWYHLQALVIHLTITGLVYGISKKVFSSLSHQLQAKRMTNYLSILAGLLFGLHPVHTEAVDYLTANFDIIAYIFFFGSFLLYLYACHSEAKPKNLTLRSFATLRMTPFIFSIILANLAFYSSEMTLTLPLLIVFYDFIFDKKIFEKIKWKEVLKLYGAFFGSAAIFLFIRFVVMQINVRGEYLGGSVYFTFLTMLKVILRYFEWLIFPLNLSINPTLPGGISAWNHPLSHPERIVSQSIFDPVILFSIAAIVSLLVLAVYCYKRYPIVTFSIGWFFISILPVLHIIPQGTIFQERYIYIASFGYVILLAWAIPVIVSAAKQSFIRSFGLRPQDDNMSLKIILILSTFILIFYGIVTFQRNRDWKDSLAVWSTLAGQSPSDVLANFHSARLYRDINQDDLAIMHYNQALAVEPNLFEVHYSLGEIYLENAKIQEAMNYFSNALKINPTFKSAENAIKNRDLIIESTQSAFFRSGLKFVDFNLPSGMVFSFPFDWEILENNDSVLLEDPNQSLKIEINEVMNSSSQSPEDFVKTDQTEYGELLNEGLVQTSIFDFAYVKVFEDKDTLKYLFFLFKDEEILKILVYPANSPSMNIFNQIISSIRLDQGENE